MAIVTVPQLSDNYAYLVIDDGSKECAVVDCAEADKVIAAAKLHGAKIVAVLTTHWHGDHSGGNNDIASKVPGIKVYGAQRGRRKDSRADQSGRRRRPGSNRRARRPRDWNPGAYQRARRLLFSEARRGVHRRHDVRRRMRPRVRGQRRDDGRVAEETRGAARLDAGLLRSRVHREKSALRADARAGQRGAEEEARVEREGQAQRASSRCRRRSATRRRPIHSCAPTAPSCAQI